MNGLITEMWLLPADLHGFARFFFSQFRDVNVPAVLRNLLLRVLLDVNTYVTDSNNRNAAVYIMKLIETCYSCLTKG